MRKIILIFLTGICLHALDINEAMQRAMKNNPTLKEKEALFKAAKEETSIARSAFRPTLDLSYEYSRFSEKNYVGADAASAADAILGYNLFNGFADRFKLKSAKESETAAQYTHDAAKADLRLSVYRAYIDYLRNEQQIFVAQETIKLLKQQLHDAENFYAQGIFAKNDYLQVDVELSSAKQAQLNAERNIKISFYRLRSLLGAQLERGEKIEPISREKKELFAARLKEKMLQNRSELKLLNAQKRAINYNYKASASNYYPAVDAEAKYEVAGDDLIPNGGATFRTHDQSSASLYLKWNLYQGGADESRRASLLHQESAENERLNALYLELDFQLDEALEAYGLSSHQIEVAQKALEQAKENFRITKEQFDANIASTSLMLDAQRFLARAQVNYYGAYFDLYDAMGKIERVVEEEVF